jgi:hypothetical protein
MIFKRLSISLVLALLVHCPALAAPLKAGIEIDDWRTTVFSALSVGDPFDTSKLPPKGHYAWRNIPKDLAGTWAAKVKTDVTQHALAQSNSVASISFGTAVDRMGNVWDRADQPTTYITETDNGTIYYLRFFNDSRIKDGGCLHDDLDVIEITVKGGLVVNMRRFSEGVEYLPTPAEMLMVEELDKEHLANTFFKPIQKFKPDPAVMPSFNAWLARHGLKQLIP